MEDEKFKELISKGAQASKNAFSKASSAVQKFSDQSVLKIQRQNAKSNLNKKYTKLGELVSSLLVKKGIKIEALGDTAVSEENNKILISIKDVQKEIEAINKEIKELEKQIEEK